MSVRKKAYVGISGDFIHHGIINIIQKAASLGDVVVGCLTDKAISENKPLPILNFEQRKTIIQNINGVKEVIAQDEWDYSHTLQKIKPDYMIHGDDWREGPLAEIREKCIKVLSQYGGELIEIPYTDDVSISAMRADIYTKRSLPLRRQQLLRRLIDSKKIVRIIETHSPVSALIAESATFETGGSTRNFDGFWSSSLTDSTEMGKPDIEVVDVTQRSKNIIDIFDVTSKPIVVDLDTGGRNEHFEYAVERLDRIGVSAIIIEDKTGLKKNSLLGNDVFQEQASKEDFSEKIRCGKAAQISDDLMIVARIESLILEKGFQDACVRCEAYVNAGADGILIHSRKKTAEEVIEFAKFHKTRFPDIPLFCVPSSYSHITAEELSNAGFNVVIYANHLMRASYKAMHATASGILEHDCSGPIEKNITGIDEILRLIPGTA